MVIEMKKEKNYINHLEENVTNIPDNPETPWEMVNKYGTYEIQPTNDIDNEFPTIAQGLPKKAKKPICSSYSFNKFNRKRLYSSKR